MKKLISAILVMLFALNFITVGYAIEPPYVQSVKINAGDTITMCVGDEITLEAEAEPQGYSYAYMVWDSNAKDVVMVNADDGTTKCEPPISTATIKAIGIGTVVVTVYADLWAEPYPDEWTEHDSITINVVSNRLLGDANGDTEIDVKDVIAVRRFLVGGYYETIFEDMVDVIKDGRIDVMDIILLRRYVAGGYGVEL